jgi:antitoxin (DNA-binding transcriptional repressor) of toxin-antitoxin stability system
MPIEQIEGRLAEVIENLPPGEEVIITRDSKAVARLVGEARPVRPGPGLGKGMVTIISEDDEHLRDLAEYVP